MRIFLMLLFFIIAHARASATEEFAVRTMLSCQACHTAGVALNAFGKAFKKNGLRFPATTKRGVPAVSFTGQLAYSSEPDPTGLPKAIVDEVDTFMSGNLNPHLHYNFENYQVDGGRAGFWQQAALQYYSNGQDTPHALRALVGLTNLPLPLQPETFRPTNAHYAVWDQTVGDNPFSFFEPKNMIAVSAGSEIHGASITAALAQPREKLTFLPQRAPDVMVSVHDVSGPFVVTAYTYNGVRGLPGGDDRFVRRGYSVNYYRDRLSLETVLQNGFNTDPVGSGSGIGSSGGFAQLRYDFPKSYFAVARYDGTSDSDGNFTRTALLGAGLHWKKYRIEVEDVLSTAGPTHNALGIVFDFAFSNLNAATSY